MYLPSVTSFCVDGGIVMVVVGAGMVVVIANKYIETWVSNRRCSAMCTTYKQILGYAFRKIFWKQTFDNNVIRSRNRFSFSSSLPVLLIFLVSCAFFFILFCVCSFCVLLCLNLLPVSLDCPFLIASYIFSSVHLHSEIKFLVSFCVL